MQTGGEDSHSDVDLNVYEDEEQLWTKCWRLDRGCEKKMTDHIMNVCFQHFPFFSVAYLYLPFLFTRLREIRICSRVSCSMTGQFFV